MRRLKHGLIGITSIVYLLGGVAMDTSLRGEAELGEWIVKVKQQMKDPKSGVGNGTLLEDRILDSTNGEANGCNSDRFKCIMPTKAFPDGEAVLDNQTMLVWDRSPHDTRNDTDGDADDFMVFEGLGNNDAYNHCKHRVIGGQMGQRLPNFAFDDRELDEVHSLKNSNSPEGKYFLPPNHPFIGIQSACYWSGTTIFEGTHRMSFRIDSDTEEGGPQPDGCLTWCVQN